MGNKRVHSEETKKKIAESNTGKIFSEERRKNIGLSKQTKISDDVLKEIQKLWMLGYIHENHIMNQFGFGKKVYDRLKKEHCKIKQIQFLPRNMTKEEIEFIIQQCQENIPFTEIAEKLDRHKKQVRNIIVRLSALYNIEPTIKPKGNHTKEHRKFLSEKMSQYNVENPKFGKNNGNFGKGLKGPLNGNWKGGISSIIALLRTQKRYRKWRLLVFKRDLFKCVFCESKKNIHSDHIYPLRLLMDDFKIKSLEDAINCSAMYDVENGRTLCESCHRKTETWGLKLEEQKKLFQNENPSKKKKALKMTFLFF